MSERANVGQAAIGEMGIGVDTVSPTASAHGETAVYGTSLSVTVGEGAVHGTTTVNGTLFRVSSRIQLTGVQNKSVRLE
ncbi:hypothetical protein EXE43_20100 [Halorubrum sp. SS5]|uniref:hypothetical protein n=1 Tax=unclassified Halorubrum TaxID=2642239 RepID=UPI0010F6E6A3|nr:MULTISPECIES: hypothetical protein [unclassified Halorubrum]TKX58891.1 hypothetical protein EXE44_04930 [Halorubrum sp. SS7]TKX64603.1 hypothetical protein EXE45_16455 [Halorubrum sp. SP9]TKX84221.1 hypothetical protein EXE43_20100 [Halorubrum sp. SS5]